MITYFLPISSCFLSISSLMACLLPTPSLTTGQIYLVDDSTLPPYIFIYNAHRFIGNPAVVDLFHDVIIPVSKISIDVLRLNLGLFNATCHFVGDLIIVCLFIGDLIIVYLFIGDLIVCFFIGDLIIVCFFIGDLISLLYVSSLVTSLLYSPHCFLSLH